MSPALSTYLNVLRVVAAFVVLLSHFAYERFSRGDYLFIRDWNLGSDAVVVFFVLSGFVIQYTARNKDDTAGRFAFSRLTRLLSVAIPALLLTWVFDRMGAAIDPAAYAGGWYNPVSLAQMLALGGSFISEWTAQGVRLGTNGPWWSLSYEAAYYLLFAIAIYTRGPMRWGLLAAAMLVVGVNVLLLMPAWLVGVWVCRRGKTLVVEPGMARLLAWGPVLFYVAALATGLPDTLRMLTQVVIGSDGIMALRFSDEFVWNALLGVAVGAHLVGMIQLLAERPVEARTRSRIAWWAGASFSLYIVHYPALQLWDVLVPETLPALLRDAGLLGLVTVTCLIFASLFERPLPAFRAHLARWGIAPRAAVSA